MHSAIFSLCIDLLLLLLLLSPGARSQAPAPTPAPSPGCSPALRRLSACSTYVEAGSNLTRPRKGCCGGLAAVVDAEPSCLCRLIDDYGGFSVRVDTTRALMLHAACRVDPPPANLCAVVGFPITSLPPPPRGGPRASSTAAPPCGENGGSSSGESPMALLVILLLVLVVAQL